MCFSSARENPNEALAQTSCRKYCIHMEYFSRLKDLLVDSKLKKIDCLKQLFQALENKVMLTSKHGIILLILLLIKIVLTNNKFN